MIFVEFTQMHNMLSLSALNQLKKQKNFEKAMDEVSCSIILKQKLSKRNGRR